MAYVRYPGSGVWTNDASIFPATGAGFGAGTIDAADEEVIFVGHINIDGAATSKTISSAGGKIYWRSNTATWASAGSTVRVGLQDVDTTNGPPPRGDGTFDVHGDMVQGTNAIGASSWITTNMSTGTKTLSHGDLVALVFKMTVRNGSDSVGVIGYSYGVAPAMPTALTFAPPSTYTAITGTCPNCVIEFDDGTLATFDQGGFFSAVSTESFQDSTNPDERGNIFQVPHNCKIDAIAAWFNGNAAAADFTLNLYSDPLGTPSVVWSQTIDGELLGIGAGRKSVWLIPAGSEPELLANTDYWIAAKATGSSNLSITPFTVANASYRRFLFNGLNTRKGVRNNSSGAATETTTVIYPMSVRISHYETGGGSGGVPLIGPGGLVY
jgi:hypothetical protein